MIKGAEADRCFLELIGILLKFSVSSLIQKCATMKRDIIDILSRIDFK